MIESGQSLAELKSSMHRYPQVLVNVKTTQRIDINSSSSVQAAGTSVESQLADKGRVLLRASGTEPVIRVMVEGEDEGQVTRLSRQLADAVKEEAGLG